VNFDESVSYLYSLGNEVSAMKLGLGATEKLLRALGNPEKHYLKVQIAGTNGKGSTCAFFEAICLAAKIKTGSTTSPHLVSITERIRISGREISEKDFARHATIIRETSEKLVAESELETVPTFFEQVTAIALSAFCEAKIELAIIETGLGGRFDSTTAARAEIAAITPIDFDHQKILGESLAQIAAEKAAIIRADSKVVFAAQKKAAENVIRQRCANVGVTPQSADFPARIAGKNDGKFIVDFQTGKVEYKNVCLNLRGAHQIENAKVAILLAEIFQENFKITTENIIKGLQTAKHSGRLEFYKNILFDGAHNASGAKALKNYLDEFVAQPITLIFGAMKDKDLPEIAETLFPKADKLIFTTPDNSRSIQAKDLLEFLPKKISSEKVFVTKTVAESLEKALEISVGENLICVTGSLYLVGEAREILKNQFEI
jgi:dihydrofolate synthase/folylpolyglutamate synthase